MNDKELILNLLELKHIKPSKHWVVLAKNQIIGSSLGENIPAHKIIFLGVFNPFFQRKLAYALAVFLFTIAGIFSVINMGFLNNSGTLNIAKQSPAALMAIKSNVETFKAKSKSLANTAQYNVKGIPSAVKEVEDTVMKITAALQKDPQLAKEVALDINNNKTYLDVANSNDLRETSDILYKTIVEQLIKDLRQTTLPESQKKSLDRIENLVKEGRFTDALEDALLLDVAARSSI